MHEQRCAGFDGHASEPNCSTVLTNLIFVVRAKPVAGQVFIRGSEVVQLDDTCIKINRANLNIAALRRITRRLARVKVVASMMR